MANLTLDDNHIYRIDGKPIDGLTSTIKESGLIRGSDEWYMDRGTKIHLATQYYDEGTLDEDTVDPQIKGYLESWKRFRKDQKYEPKKIEYQIYHPLLMVGTTIDRLPGPIDLKSGVSEPWHILQIAMQWEAIKESGLYHYDTDEPMDVYLDGDGGPPKIRSYKYLELKEAFKVYTSMLYFLRWKRERGIK